MRNTLCILILLHLTTGLRAQQDPTYTQFIFSSLAFNPALAGHNEHLTLNLLHRRQWLGIDDAPVTQALTAHSPLRNKRVGLGLSLVNDKAGVSGLTELNFAYAYRFPLNDALQLSAGLQAGVSNWRGEWTSLTLEQAGDVVFQENVNLWQPNFGVGAHLSHERFYVGLSCPRLLESKLRPGNETGRRYRHYYLAAGAAIPLRGNNLVFRPAFLLKSTGLFSQYRQGGQNVSIGAPTAIDLNASLFIIQTFTVGAAYRTALEGRKTSHDSADLWAAWHLRNGLRFGMAYDLTMSKLRLASNGSLEFMIGYEFDIKVSKAASPRFF